MRCKLDSLVYRGLIHEFLYAPMHQLLQFLNVILIFEHLLWNIVDMDFDLINFLVEVYHHTTDVGQVNVRFGHFVCSFVSFVF